MMRVEKICSMLVDVSISGVVALAQDVSPLSVKAFSAKSWSRETVVPAGADATNVTVCLAVDVWNAASVAIWLAPVVA